ncbi:hypothetical protein ANCCEY_11532 [Ancylostoma ceylanicum]|nr:hypothetical protein ANCCEY_11532 [Ancylostoma ceylanicum]
MDVLLLFLLYALLVVNVISKCSKKKSDKTESRKKKKRHRSREREPKESSPKEQPPVGPPPEATPIPPEPVVAVTTAHEADDVPAEEMFKCRDYTPAIFQELQNLFDLLKQSS